MMSADEQREAFHNALSQSLGEECGFDLLQTVHEQLKERIDQHRQDRDPEPLGLTAREVGDILASGGVSRERLTAFDTAMADHFGENAVLNPSNVIDSKRFEIITPEVRISVDPSCSYLVETRIIDGRRYLLIPAGHDVTVNGIPVTELPTPDGDPAALTVGLVPEAEPEDGEAVPEDAEPEDGEAVPEDAEPEDGEAVPEDGETVLEDGAEASETDKPETVPADSAAETTDDDTPPWE